MNKYLKLLIMAIIVVSYGCTTQPDYFSEEFKANINKRVDDGLIQGLVIGVITEDGIAYYSYGVKSLETKEAVDEHTIFEIGSNTKTFTGVILANEVINGNLKLNDPIQKLLPEDIIAPTRNGEEIKLVHIANHSSSLPRVPTNFKRTDPLNPYADHTKEQLYDDLNNYELTRDIGSKFEYSNYGIGLLGCLLSDLNKTSYENLVLETIIKPLGMNNTGITLTPEMKSQLAYGHDDGVQVPNWDINSMAGAGALKSNAEDMLKYLAANMGMQKTDLYPAMELAHKPTGCKVDYLDSDVGLGWINSKLEGVDIIWHDGGTGGYMSFMGFRKDINMGVVVLTNATNFPDDIGLHLLNSEYELKKPE